MIDGVDRRLPRLLNRTARALLAPALRASGALTIHGAERLPTGGPAIVACNHASFADSVYLTAAIRPSLVVCGGKPRLFKNRRRRALMAFANVLRVDDHAQYVADCTALLARGRVLLVYPEMGRRPRLDVFSTWPAEVALAAGVPVLPVFLHGTGEPRERRVSLFVGRPLEASGDAEALTEALHAAVSALEPR
ncbi:MAG: 1-acyl-sn-glycerol-3-phosphate acyltransferase [Deltaproteobacteria bacterium]|nr:MAG: 1-acyl-sn-glycerol-3-phosphate acyltransferase [Deltaproteobacteria bacterium]